MTAPERFADSQIPLAPRAPSIHDPSPFHERDLDPDAKEYTVGSAEEVARPAPLCLVVHLPADQLPNWPLRISARQSITTLPIAQKVSGGGYGCYFMTVVSP